MEDIHVMLFVIFLCVIIILKPEIVVITLIGLLLLRYINKSDQITPLEPTPVLKKSIEENVKAITIEKKNPYENYPGAIEESVGDDAGTFINKCRNEPTRVIIGMNDSYNKLNRYIREEIDETECNKEWWGQNDY